MKIRMKSTTGLAPTAADPPPVAPAGTTQFRPRNSRRVTANADHANGPAAGAPPSPPEPSHANNFAPIPETDPRAAAFITGAETAGPAAGTAAPAAPCGATDATDWPPTRLSTRLKADSAPPALPDCAPAAGVRATTSSPPLGWAVTFPEDIAGAEAPSSDNEPRACTDDPGPLFSTAAGARPRDPFVAVPKSPDPDPAPSEDPAPADYPRAAPRPLGDPTRFDDRGTPTPDAPCSADAVDPADPVVSAAATGMASRADPTPNATAKAPTRPTYRA